MLKSIDGGKTFKRVKGMHHGDHHDLWIDPKNPQRMIDGNDGGVDISTDGGKTWFAAAVADQPVLSRQRRQPAPYRVMGCMQDLGTASGPSNSLTAAASAWAIGTASAAARPASPCPTRPTRTSSMPANTAATSRATTTAPASNGTSDPARPTSPATAPRT